MSTPVGPYAPAMRAGEWLVTSGQIGVRTTADGPALVAGGFAEQAHQALTNVGEVLAGRSLGWRNVVKATVFLADMADYAEFNEVYLGFIGDHRPARSVVGVAALPLGALVEVEVLAFAG
jgi:2-iminobutanoate/2-iminopropanoate deaminase